jgi:putative DNA primase/helicase
MTGDPLENFTADELAQLAAARRMEEYNRTEGIVPWIVQVQDVQERCDPATNEAYDALQLLPPPSNPMAVARVLLQQHCHQPTGAFTLRHWRGSWMQWIGPAWSEVEDRTIRADLYHQVETANYSDGDKIKPWAPNRHRMADLVDAVAAITHLSQQTQPPAWLKAEWDSTQLIACRNGLLDVASRALIQHSPNYFNTIAVPFDYDPDALEPTGWFEFLNQLWGEDDESIALLQQWFGYILSGQTNQQKIMGIIGPLRSGKGTICRVLRNLVGERNVTAPTLSSFRQNFGLMDMVDKPVAIIGDVRLGGGEQHAVVERLLSISGEDTITLDRKYKEPWTGQLPTRIMFVSNELPRFGDASGAIATRCLILETTRSFLGVEDKNLTRKLTTEMAGILNWSLDGLRSLNELGRFIEPQSSVDTVTALADIVSPTSAFVRDRCVRGPAREVPVDDLYGAWRSWCLDNGRDHPGTLQTFGRDLRAVVPGLKITQPRAGDRRVRCYQGIALSPDHNG